MMSFVQFLLVGVIFSLETGFSADFQAFLNTNYRIYQFDRPDIRNACFGGAESRPLKVPTRIPIVFIHGNSDIGVGDGEEGSTQTGFRSQIEFFLSKGYGKEDLYVTTWGDANQLTAALKYHSENNIKYLRAFVEAVIKYTKADYINIISHSMGVTLGRKIVKGGYANDELGSGKYYVGDQLKVKIFVGLAGANQGLSACYTSGTLTPTCGMTNGFYPGSPPFVSKSSFLSDLENSTTREAQYIVSGRAVYDEIIGGGNLVYGKLTTKISNENEEIVLNSPLIGHFALRDLTGSFIYNIYQKREGILN